MPNKKTRTITYLLIACLALGFILTRQFYFHKQVNRVVTPENAEDQAIQISQLLQGNKELTLESNRLRNQYETLKRAAQNGKAAQDSLDNSIEQYKIILGTIPVKGEGVSIFFKDQLDTTQITDLVNSLRNMGAEAIAINNHRITPHTGWDKNTFSAPYSIEAIGDKAVLKESLERSGGIMEQIGLATTVKQESDLTLPAKK